MCTAINPRKYLATNKKKGATFPKVDPLHFSKNTFSITNFNPETLNNNIGVQTTKIMLLIGIDIGLQKNNTGVALYDPQSKTIDEIFSCNLYECLRYLERKILAYPRKIGVVLEDAGKDNATFKKGKNAAIQAKISRDAGKNQAGATVVRQLCNHFRVPCLLIAPSQRRQAKPYLKFVKGLPYPTKTTKEQFNTLTGCFARTNEHNRDAGTLVWGMSQKEFENRIKMQGL